MKGKTRQNLIVFSPTQPKFSAQNFSLDISKLSRDHSKVHWKQGTYGVGIAIWWRRGLETCKDNQEQLQAAEHSQASTLKQVSERLYSAHPCWTLRVGLQMSLQATVQTQKAPVSAQMCGVWAASKGWNGAIFGKKGAGKEENKPDPENPTNGRNIPPQ